MPTERAQEGSPPPQFSPTRGVPLSLPMGQVGAHSSRLAGLKHCSGGRGKEEVEEASQPEQAQEAVAKASFPRKDAR